LAGRPFRANRISGNVVKTAVNRILTSRHTISRTHAIACKLVIHLRINTTIINIIANFRSTRVYGDVRVLTIETVSIKDEPEQAPSRESHEDEEGSQNLWLTVRFTYPSML
jgi:hypothetical protein